jgi:hypothetical protein
MRPGFYVVALAAILVLGACNGEPSETYGFVATLGEDTTSVEWVTRTSDRIISDAVGRSPVVVRRHWEATLAPDGTIRRWTMDTTIPNAPPDAAELHHTAVFTDSGVRLRTRGSEETLRSVAYRKKYAVTVPWNAFVYGTYELVFDAARSLDDSTQIGQYFFEGWDEGHIGYARVRDLGDGRYSIRSTGLAGAGVGRLDERGRMLSYSGQGTTYKQEVERITEAPDIDAITARFAAEEKARGVSRALSERDTTRETIAGTTFTIDYSRPAARGRTLLGGLIPYGEVWRTGANAATQLTISRPARVAGIELDSGSYTLWTLPTEHDVRLIINGETGQWGTRYRSSEDIARVEMEVDTLPSPVERFTIRVEPDTTGDSVAGAPGAAGQGAAGRLVMEWGTFRWSVSVLVDRNADPIP